MQRIVGDEPEVELPERYCFHVFSETQIARWLSLLNESGDFAICSLWSRDILEREILSRVLPDGVALIANPASAIVACGALCHDEAPNCARVMYVLVSRRERGKGLGTAITNRLLSVAKNNRYQRVVLNTQPHRKVAIKMYERLGFSILPKGKRG